MIKQVRHLENEMNTTYGPLLSFLGNPSGAQDYFVDLNVINSGDGKSWKSPFKTIAEAITASNLTIVAGENRWWARRNRIFVLGDEISEDITVLPEKCDIIGCGYDIYPFPRVIGHWHIATTRPAAGKANGCRFINMGFQATGTAEVLLAPAGCHGLTFQDCVFTASAAGNTKALAISDCASVKIDGCRFLSSAGALTTSVFGLAISIEGTTSIHDLQISNNKIFATAGIAIAAGTLQGSFVNDNYIRSLGSGKACVDSSNDVAFVNNRIITAVADTAVANQCTWNEALAVGNMITTGTARTTAIPIAVVMAT